MKKIILLVSCASLFIACIAPPDYDDLSSELIVTTNKDKAADFKSYGTFYVSDTIVNIGGEDEDTIWHDEDAAQIVARIKDNMQANGYTYVQRHQSPDIAMAVGAIKILNVEYYPGWWWGYPGWFPWYGGWYPYYYPWSTVYAYNTGTMIIDAYDAKNAEENGQFRAIWNSTSFGALGESTNGNIERAENAVEQAYEQSPYFKAN